MSFNVMVGVTTDPTTKRSFFQNHIRDYCNFQIIETYTSREDAQDYANRYADTYGCEMEPACTEAGPVFYVFRLEYKNE